MVSRVNRLKQRFENIPGRLRVRFNRVAHRRLSSRAALIWSLTTSCGDREQASLHFRLSGVGHQDPGGIGLMSTRVIRWCLPVAQTMFAPAPGS